MRFDWLSQGKAFSVLENLSVWFSSYEVVLFFVAALAAFMLLREKRRAAADLKLLGLAANIAGNGLVFFDKKGRFIYANKQAESFIPEILLGKANTHSSLSDFLDYFYDHAAEYDEGLANTLGRTAENRERFGFREVIKTNNGRLCLVESEKAERGDTVLILTDFGVLKDQEDQVLRLNQFNYELNQAIEAATSGIIVTKPQAKGTHLAVFVNRAFCDTFGLKRDQIVGRDMTDVFAKIKDKEALKELYRIDEQKKTGTVELRFKNEGETERLYELQMTPVKDYAGNLELFVGILNDTTELKMRQAESSKAQKLEALGQLSAGVAHDFNNVLSIIDGYTRLSASRVKDDPKVSEYLERIHIAAQRGAALIKQMLTFSRHEIVENTVINLGEAVKEQETLLLPLLDASIKFKVLVDAEEMHVECPPDNITQILMNLVVNARDAMPYGGTLLVESRVVPEDTLPTSLREKSEGEIYTQLSVSDTGTGMEKDIIERIFDPFFTTKDQGQGTGLGLSMVYGLVKQIGGIIDVDSVTGRGTTISIYLPLTDKKPNKYISGSVDDMTSIRFDGYTALIVEDEPDLRDLVSNMLSDLGMDVLTAKDGHEALAVQDDYEEQIDLLLTDVAMPELNGVELADLVSELRPDIMVVFMSGYPVDGQGARVEIPEHAVFIAKPIQYNDLVKLIFSKLHDPQNDTTETPRWTTKQTPTDEKEVTQ